MNGVEVKLFRFQKGKLLCFVASESYEEAKALAERVLNKDPEGIRIYTRTKARIIYMEDFDEMLAIDDWIRALAQEEQEKGGLTN